MPEKWRQYRLEVRGVLKALSPMHVGSGQMLHIALDAPILRERAGRPYIPGASIRGVWKHWLEDERVLLDCSKKAFLNLFGKTPTDGGDQTESQLGRLTVEEAWMENPPEKEAEVRDHVRIDGETGAAAEGAKFDGEVLREGATFQFRMAYEGDDPGDPELVLVREALRLVASGAMRVGAKSGWGYGAVQLQQAEHREFQRNTTAGLTSWLAARTGTNRWLAGLPAMIATPDGADQDARPYSCLTFQMRFHFEGPMLVRSSVPPKPDDENPAPDAVFITTGPNDNSPYLPGSSLRGVLRSHACWIAGEVNQDLVKTLFGPELDGAEDNKARRGLIEISDGDLVGPIHRVLLDHVAIDRIMGGARDGAKFNAQPLDSPTFDVTIRVRFRNGEAPALALWGRVLRDILRNPGDLWVGASTSRGYGYMRYGEALSATLDLVQSAAVGVVFPRVLEQRPGRVLYQLLKPAFADFAPLWTLATDTWKQGGNPA